MRGLLIAAIVLFLLPAVSASVLVSQPAYLYNAGDELDMNVVLKPASNTQDFLKVKLNCGQGIIEMHNAFYSVGAGAEKTINVNVLLNSGVVNDISGPCYISSSYGGETGQSQAFELSRKIEPNAEINNVVFSPKDIMRVLGSAKKENGKKVDGFVEISIGTLGIFASGPIKGGNFNTNVTLPEKIPAGEHDVLVYTYDKDSYGKVLNSGQTIKKIKVKEVLKSLEIELFSPNVEPEEALKYKFIAYDQSGNVINREVSYSVHVPDGKAFSSGRAKANEEIIFDIKSSYAPGYWKVEGKAENIVSKNLFYIPEYEKIEFELVNGTLLVRNAGNVAYNKPISIALGDISFVKDVSLKINEIKKFKLSAPNDFYNIVIEDGNSELFSGTALLTGKAVGVDEVSRVPFVPIVIFVLIITSLLILTNARIYSINKNNSSESKPDKSAGKEARPGELFIVGKKEDASVIVLKTDFADNALFKEAYDKLIENARKSKAHITEENESIIFVLGKNISGTQEIAAVTLAQEMERILADYNKRAKEKVGFGIAINQGSIIAENDRGQFRFTSIGNFIPKTKKIADSARKNNELLLSDAAYKKVMANVKGEKVSDDIWRIKRIVQREKYDSFISKFLKDSEKK